MKTRCASLVLSAACLVLAAVSASAQIHPTPYFTNFYDDTYSSTINGQLLPVGTVIEAYDPDGVLCGTDTVAITPGPGAFGFMPVYGDDLSNTPALDEGAEPGETITFKINHRTATVVSGNAVWADQASRSVQLSVTASLAISKIDAPTSAAVAPGDTIDIQIEVRNDGDGLDLYGIKFSMTLPEGTDTLNEWEALPPAAPVYANAGETVIVPFKVRSPVWGADTVNAVTWTVYSLVDSTVKVVDDIDVYRTITDVDDGGDLMPRTFALFQNYPNPFNPTTTISFELQSRSRVRLEVFDVLGRSVEERDLGMLSSGVHSVEFDASRLASGMYFYRLSTETGVQTRKMTLIK